MDTMLNHNLDHAATALMVTGCVVVTAVWVVVGIVAILRGVK